MKHEYWIAVLLPINRPFFLSFPAVRFPDHQGPQEISDCHASDGLVGRGDALCPREPRDSQEVTSV